MLERKITTKLLEWKKEEKKHREMCEKRKEKMIIEIALLLINEFTPE